MVDSIEQARSSFFHPIDVYLVNPQNKHPTSANQWAMATFDLCMADCKLKQGVVILEQWARGINVRLVNYLTVDWGRHDRTVNIPSWMIDSPEAFDRLFFGAIDELCKLEGLSFAGMIESLGFLLQ